MQNSAGVIENLIQDLAHSLGHWAYLLVAFMASAETAAFLGFIAPGEFTIILGGVLAGEGTLSIQLLIGIVWASIVLGDSIGFYIGRRFGRDLLVRHGPKIRLTEDRLHQVESYFQRHGGKTIFFGRWVGFVRPLMPFTAGTSGIPYRRFLPYDVLSAGLFGSTFSLLGYIFWRNFDTVAKVVGRGALGLGILAALIIGGVIAFRRLRRSEQRRQAAAALARLGRKPLLRPVAAVVIGIWRVVLHPLWRFVLRPVKRFVLVPVRRFVLVPVWRVLAPPIRFLAHRLTPGELGIELTTLVAIAAVGGYAFGAYADVLNSSPGIITPGDGFSRDIAHDIRSGTITAVAKIITAAGTFGLVAVLVTITAAALAFAGRRLEAVVLVSGMVLTQVGVHIAKAIVDRPRPPDELVHANGSSFPSGHAATAIAYVALGVVFARLVRAPAAKVAIVAVGVAAAVLIGLSRVYLRVHYLSDVTAGWALGLAVYSLCGALAVVVSYVRNNERSRDPGPTARAAGTAGEG